MTQFQGSTDGGKTARTMGEMLSASLAGRRILMLARDAETAATVEQALRDNDVPVQRLTVDDIGLHAVQLTDDRERPSLPTGGVAIMDAETCRAASETRRTTRAAEAVMEVISSANQGSTTDHLLMVTQEEAMRDALRTMNVLMDRMVEADLVDEAGGPARVSPMIRRFMRWLPQDEARPDPVLVAPTGRAATMLAHAAAMAATVHSTLVVKASAITDQDEAPDHTGPDGYKLEMSPVLFEDRTTSLALDDARLDSLFGDDVMARERAMRSTYVLRDESHMMDMPILAAELPPRGYDFRGENDAFNRRRDGSKGRGRR